MEQTTIVNGDGLILVDVRQHSFSREGYFIYGW